MSCLIFKTLTELRKVTEMPNTYISYYVKSQQLFLDVMKTPLQSQDNDNRFRSVTLKDFT